MERISEIAPRDSHPIAIETTDRSACSFLAASFLFAAISVLLRHRVSRWQRLRANCKSREIPTYEIPDKICTTRFNNARIRKPGKIPIVKIPFVGGFSPPTIIGIVFSACRRLSSVPSRDAFYNAIILRFPSIAIIVSLHAGITYYYIPRLSVIIIDCFECAIVRYTPMVILDLECYNSDHDACEYT